MFSSARHNGLVKLGTWGTEIHPDLPVASADMQVVKHRVSPFYSTNLEVQLRANGLGRIYRAGVSTQAVVQATVRDGRDRDYEMIVLEDCCAAHSEAEHANSIGSLGRFCKEESSQTVVFG